MVDATVPHMSYRIDEYAERQSQEWEVSNGLRIEPATARGMNSVPLVAGMNEGMSTRLFSIHDIGAVRGK
jgi:hypothetical protein